MVVKENKKRKYVICIYKYFMLNKIFFCAMCSNFVVYECGCVQNCFFTTTTTNLKNIFNIGITEMHIYFFKKMIINAYFNK